MFLYPMDVQFASVDGFALCWISCIFMAHDSEHAISWSYGMGAVLGKIE